MSTDVFIVIGFLALNLGVGLYYGRGVKTIKDYALGGRNFSTGTLISTIVATWIGGDYLFITLSEVYTTGLHYAIGCLGMAFCLYITGYIFVPRMEEFLGTVSVAEAMGNLYGKKARIITAFTGSIAAAGFIALQFKVLGNISTYLDIDIGKSYSIFIIGLVTIIYSAFGGIKSITFTDVVQFFTFGVLIPVLGFIIWNDVNNLQNFNLIKTIENPLFDYKEFIGLSNPKFWKLLFLWLLFAIPGFDPALFQRISIGTTVEQVKRAFTISSLLLLLILLGMSWISFLLFNIDSNLDQNSLILYITKNYAVGWLKIFIIIGIIAMCMSTSDSNLNSASVALTHDFCYPLKIKLKKELVLSKITTVLLGFVALILATSERDMLELVFMTQSFYSPIVGVPLMLAILGFRSTKKVLYISMVAGFVAVVIWRVFFMDITSVDSIVPGMLTNLMFFIGSHYLLVGKRVVTKKKLYTVPSINKLQKQNDFISHIKSILGFSFISFCKDNSPKNEVSYTGFGIFTIISTICTMYSVSNILGNQYKTELLILYEVMLIISIAFITYPIWPLSIKKTIIVQVSWNVAIFFLLIFTNTFFIILAKFAPLQFVVFTVNLIAAALLTKWKTTLFMLLAGLYTGIQYYKYFTGLNNIDLDISATAFILYSFLLSGTAIIILLKPKQEYIETTEQKTRNLEKEVDYTQRELANITQGMDFLEKQLKQKEGSLKKKELYLRDQVKLKNAEISKLTDMKDEFLRNIMHESNTPMTGIISMCDVLYSCYDQLDNNQIKRTIKDIVNSGDRLKSYVNSIVDLSKLTSKKYNLTKEDVNLGKLAEERTILYKKIFSDEAEAQEFIFNIEEDFIVNCDKYYITQTIDNLISNAVTYGRGKPITISLKREEDGSTSFSIKDQGIGIPKLELISIFEKFSVGSKTKTPAGGRGVGLALCKSALEAHDGTINATSDEKGSIFTFTLPQKA